MNASDLDLSQIPEAFGGPFTDFAGTLRQLAGDDLLGLLAIGGWTVGDPFYAQAPARSVVVLKRINLPMLERLASEAAHFGKLRISAPLIMTPEYVRESCDVFPLELLEIQQLHARLIGEDYFADLKFAPADVRLQCERELKSELIQLRQGLLAAGGRHKLLPDLVFSAAERSLRILRGLLHLDDEEQPQRSAKLATRAAEVSGVGLATLKGVVSGAGEVDFGVFQRFYAEVEALAAHADKLHDAPGKPTADSEKPA